MVDDRTARLVTPRRTVDATRDSPGTTMNPSDQMTRPMPGSSTPVVPPVRHRVHIAPALQPGIRSCSRTSLPHLCAVRWTTGARAIRAGLGSDPTLQPRLSCQIPPPAAVGRVKSANPESARRPGNPIRAAANVTRDLRGWPPVSRGNRTGPSTATTEIRQDAAVAALRRGAIGAARLRQPISRRSSRGQSA